jgi:hypothetical protein
MGTTWDTASSSFTKTPQLIFKLFFFLFALTIDACDILLGHRRQAPGTVVYVLIESGFMLIAVPSTAGLTPGISRFSADVTKIVPVPEITYF